MTERTCTARLVRAWWGIASGLGIIAILAGSAMGARAQAPDASADEERAGQAGGGLQDIQSAEGARPAGSALEGTARDEDSAPRPSGGSGATGSAASSSSRDATGAGSGARSGSVLQPGDLEEDEEGADAAAEPEGGAPAADEAEAEVAQAARAPLPWRNSFFSWTHGVTPNTFVPGGQLSYNPTYYWSFNFAPRWYLDPATFFFVSQSLFYELTNDDGTSAYNHDLQLSDTIVEIRRTIPWEGFVFIPAARVVFPVSKLSQAAQRYVGGGFGLTAVRPIPEAAGLTFALIGRYQYWWAGSNVSHLMGGVPGDTGYPTPATHMQTRLDDRSGASYLDAPLIDQTAVTTPRHMAVAGLTINITPIPNTTFSFGGFYVAMEGHGLAPACYHALTSPTADCIPDNGPTHWRHFTWASLSVAYDVQSWLNLSLGYQTAAFLAPLFNDDGSVRSPFNPDANFFLTATLQIDALYEAVAGGEDDGLTPEQRQRRRQGLAQRTSLTGGSL